MGVEVEFSVEGVKEFEETVDRLIKGVHPDRIEPHLRWGAGVIAKEVRANTPHIKGTLYSAIRVKKLKRWGGPAPYIAAIDRKKAPHAHLVIKGTKLRLVNPPRIVNIRGNVARIDNTGVMPSNTFFRDAIRDKQDTVLNGLEKRVAKMLTEAMK